MYNALGRWKNVLPKSCSIGAEPSTLSLVLLNSCVFTTRLSWSLELFPTSHLLFFFFIMLEKMSTKHTLATNIVINLLSPPIRIDL